MTTTRIVPYQAEHWTAVVQMMAALQEHERELSPDRSVGAPMAAAHTDYLLGLCRANSGQVFVAVDEQANLQGFVVVFIDSEDADDEHLLVEWRRFAYVSDLYVRPNFRGIGLAQRLMQAAEQHGRDQGVRRIKVSALVGNQIAQRFYSGNGYRAYEVTFTKDLE